MYIEAAELRAERLQKQTEWQPMSTAPQDRPVLVKYDYSHNYLAEPETLSDYAVHCESGSSYFSDKGVCIAHWAPAYDDDNGWESGQSWTMPPVWLAWFNNDFSEYVVNPVQWMEIPE